MSQKIIIADDHTVVLFGISIMLKHGLPETKVETVKSYPELLEIITLKEFDILLLDINMPGAKNLNMVEEIKKICPNIKIMIFTTHDESLGLEYIKVGADGYLNKLSKEEEIIYAIKSLINDGFYYSQKLAKTSILGISSNTIFNNPESLLTKREMEVYHYILKGYRTADIANELNIHISTISSYKKRVLKKLNVSSAFELVEKYHIKK